MKKLFLSIVAASMLLSACNQAAKQTNTSDSTTTPASTTVKAKDSAAATPASSGPVMTNGPEMKFEYTTHDFGKIQQGDKVTYKFNFANVGKAPLIITDAVASCGCTTPNWPKTPIKPGEGGQIEVIFNSTGKKGLQDKMVTVTANTNPRQNVVHMVGEVLEKK